MAHGTFNWNELMTNDVETAKNFYAETLGWSFDAMPMPQGGTYWIAKIGDKMVGGIFDANAAGMTDAPEMWMAYIDVDDVDARVAKAKMAGATIAREPWHVEGVGRIAMLKQPGGGTIGWITPAPAA